MIIRLTSLVTVLFLIISSKAFCQDNKEPLLSIHLNQAPFTRLVEEIESKSDYHFYYDSKQIDTIRVSLQAEQKNLPYILSKVFGDSGFHFAIDRHQRVFITRDRAILTTLLTDSLISTLPLQNKLTETTPQDAAKEKINTAVENKLFEIGNKNAPAGTGKATLAGTIKDNKTGEPVIGAVVFIEEPRIGVSTDQFGYYSITLPKGRHEVLIRSLGMRDTKRQIALYTDGRLDIDMQDQVIGLKEVVVQAEKAVNVTGVQMGVEKLNIKTIKQIPTVFGEADILRVVLTLPGVKTVGEASTGFNVRGGSTDQNLILFNDATIYNPSHLFGFFSAFNPDVVKNVELFKSGIPAKYGGRLASVLEITSRDGNKKKFAGSGGIGLLTGRLTLEGPIIKDKTSFILGGRSTYSNWLLGQLKNTAYQNSKASFYDVNLHVSHEFNNKNSLYFTGYLSKDRFKFNTDTLYGYQNQIASLKWKHVFSNKLFSVVTGGFTKYQYSILSDKNPVNAFKLAFDITQNNLKADFSYFLSERHTLDFGASTIHYKLHPGSYSPQGSESLTVPETVQAEQGLESAFYISDRFEITPKLSLTLGLRYSLFNYLGAKEVLQYAPGLPKEEVNIADTLSYAKGKTIQTYHGPEYRLSARYVITENSSIKLSYNTLRQYIHMLSNTTAISPTDIWKLSDTHIKPQFGDQISLGLYKNFNNNSIETSVELYHKNIRNFLDYKSGAKLIMNQHIETDVISTQGRAYGVEVLVKKLTGKLNGWMAYTYSRTLLRMDDATAGEMINQGKWYPANFDKPHDFTLIGNYRFSHRFSTSLNFTYSTGRPVTLPLSYFDMGGSTRTYYSERNQYRIPDYYRVDFSMNIEGNHKIKKLAHSSWTLAIYNLTGRKNAYSVYFKSENGKVNGYKLSIFGQPIPTVTYNFRF
ncbi:TonB-dependent receptor [Rhodocytophaga rosea]|uniref:TonB-dependent receptor n=1 Tax=Rhodocytophaga rosea TaxID=2704465 RepID=A0A6C0GC65_9BACT|nr:TonB-dependent receptor [Rhodocytophaga rosea]QHT65541.1 TonB-dependent receptor [Rhodocytophaga rosea]